MMSLFKRDNFIAGLDVGTTKTVAVVGRVAEDGSLKIEGYGLSPSKGIKKSMVINLQHTVRSIYSAIREAELCAGIPIESAFVGISGGQIRGFNSRGVIAVEGRQKEISRKDVDRVLKKTRQVAIPSDREILHVIPQEFIVDKQGGIRDPVGMAGVHLEVEAHITTNTIMVSKNMKKCVNKAGLEVEELVLEQIGSALDVLTKEERSQGAALVDIGGGSSGLIIFVDGCIWHTAVIPLGGDQITNDLAIGLKTPTSEAERIKKQYGSTMIMDPGENDENVVIQSLSGRKERLVPCSLLTHIIQPRVEEILSVIYQEIKRMGYDELLNMGIVITGGTSLLKGMVEIAEKIFQLPVRQGMPMESQFYPLDLSHPGFSCVRGLLKYGLESRANCLAGKRSQFKLIKRKLSNWISGNSLEKVTFTRAAYSDNFDRRTL